MQEKLEEYGIMEAGCNYVWAVGGKQKYYLEWPYEDAATMQG